MLNPTQGPGVAGASEVGRVRFLTTNGGPHSAESWAEVTADTILDLIQIEPTGTPATIRGMTAKISLRQELIALFTQCHRSTQMTERNAIVKKTLADPLEPMVLVACAQLDRLLATTMFATHFARDDVRKIIHRIIAQHTADVMHIERRYHADKQGE